MKTPMKEKPRIVQIRDSAEIASIQRADMEDIIGGCDKRGNYWAYRFSLDRWRKRSRESYEHL